VQLREYDRESADVTALRRTHPKRMAEHCRVTTKEACLDQTFWKTKVRRTGLILIYVLLGCVFYGNIGMSNLFLGPKLTRVLWFNVVMLM
jgi:hypothetical protein